MTKMTKYTNYIITFFMLLFGYMKINAKNIVNIDVKSENVYNVILFNLSKLFKAKLQQQGTTIEEISKLTNISLDILSDFEQGECIPELKILIKLVMVLDIKIEELSSSLSFNYNLVSTGDDKATTEAVLISYLLSNNIPYNVVLEIIDFINYKEKNSYKPRSNKTSTIIKKCT